MRKNRLLLILLAPLLFLNSFAANVPKSDRLGYIDCSKLKHVGSVPLIAAPTSGALVIDRAGCESVLYLAGEPQNGWIKVDRGFHPDVFVSADLVQKVEHVSGEVQAPKQVYSPAPAYSNEGREKGIQGTVVLFVVVGPDGVPHLILVQRSLGSGLDEEAVKAVQSWKFEPATRLGVPVPVALNIEIKFRL